MSKSRRKPDGLRAKRDRTDLTGFTPVTTHTCLFFSQFVEAADQMLIERLEILATFPRSITDEVVLALLPVTFNASKDEIVEIVPTIV